MIAKPDNYNYCDFCVKEKAESIPGIIVIKGPFGCHECGQAISYCEECLHKLIDALYDWKVKQEEETQDGQE